MTCWVRLAKLHFCGNAPGGFPTHQTKYLRHAVQQELFQLAKLLFGWQRSVRALVPERFPGEGDGPRYVPIMQGADVIRRMAAGKLSGFIKTNCQSGVTDEASDLAVAKIPESSPCLRRAPLRRTPEVLVHQFQKVLAPEANRH